MTRHYALVQTAVWRPESTFCDLTADEQRMYLLLFSQQDISAAGVLTLAVDRWAGHARDTTADDVRLAIKGLVAAGHVVVDERTQELLLRAFVAQDRGYNNQKRKPVIVRAATEVRSATLRTVLAEDLPRLDIHVEGLASPVRGGSGGDAMAPVRGPESADASGATTFPQADILSDGASAHDGVVVTQGLHHEPPTQEPQPPTRAAVRAVVDHARAIRRDWNVTTVERAVRRALKAGHTLAVIDTELSKLATDPVTECPGRLNARGRYWLTAEPTEAGEPARTHDFVPSDDDPLACAQCHMIRGNRHHRAAAADR